MKYLYKAQNKQACYLNDFFDVSTHIHHTLKTTQVIYLQRNKNVVNVTNPTINY